MNVVPKRSIERAIKRLSNKNKLEFDQAVRDLMENPHLGEMKLGNLAGIRVYKFRLNRQLVLLAYSYEETSDTLSLLMFGTHENFYRDLRRLD